MRAQIAVVVAAALLVNAAAAQTTSSMTFCAGAEGHLPDLLYAALLTMHYFERNIFSLTTAPMLQL